MPVRSEAPPDRRPRTEGARRNTSLDPRTAGRRATTTYRLGPPAIIHGQARVRKGVTCLSPTEQ